MKMTYEEKRILKAIYIAIYLKDHPNLLKELVGQYHRGDGLPEDNITETYAIMRAGINVYNGILSIDCIIPGFSKLLDEYFR